MRKPFKQAVSAYSKLYAESYASKNVRMNCVLPGHMDSLDHQATAEQAVPKNGIGTEQKIVKTVAFPLSGEAGYITGQSMRINGGVTRHI